MPTGSWQYPSKACYCVFSGIEPSSSGESMNVFKQINYYKNSNSLEYSRSDLAWYKKKTQPNGAVYYSAFSVYGSKTNEVKPFVRFYTTTGSDKKYELMVGVTYDIWALF